MPKLYSKSLMVLVLLSLSLTAIAQDKQQTSIVKADSTWNTEIIPFPVGWLPKLTLKGLKSYDFRQIGQIQNTTNFGHLPWLGK